MRRVVPLLICCLTAVAGDGVHPLGNASDYQAQQDEKTATIAAAVLSQDQIKKVFGADVGRRYLIVEVAIYPNPAFEVDPFDFRLKDPNGDLMRPETPRDVAEVWNEKDPRTSTETSRGPTVTNEAGVAYENGRDPYTGQRRSGVSTYEGTTVTNDPRAQAPPPGPKANPDGYAIAAKIHDFALPEGKARDAVAGYLYFPKPSKKGKDVTLLHSHDGASVSLPLVRK
jgi:hypothetical protein